MAQKAKRIFTNFQNVYTGNSGEKMEKKPIIDCISDTHSKHHHLHLSGGDILIHAGDCTSMGTLNETLKFLDWFGRQNYTHRLLIAGNHDLIFEKEPEKIAEECSNRDIILLNDSGIELEGIKIWGSPVTPWYDDWAYNRHRGEEIKKHWDLIPSDTEILVTHGPSYGTLDEVKFQKRFFKNVGCEELQKKIQSTDIKLHVFGHIHEGRNVKQLDQRISINASSLNEHYKPYKTGFTRILKQNSGYSLN